MRYKIKTITNILIAFIFAGAVFAAVSCGKKETTASGVAVRPARGDEVGKEAVCPVTKNKFKITEQTAAADIDGKTYYFCCPGCDEEFAAAPQKYSGHEARASGPGNADTRNGDGVLYWTCSMHPSVRADKPGKCPICAMALIPVSESDAGKITVDKKTAEALGIKTSAAKTVAMVKTVRLPAKVAYDNELYLAQQEYLSSFRNLTAIKDEAAAPQAGRVRDILESARFRLDLMGYGEADIKELEKAAEPDRNLIFPGAKVWLHADVYEHDIGLVRPGQSVTATAAAYPSEKFRGTVRFMEKTLNPATRAARTRILVDNPGERLKLEMFADLELKASLGRHLAVPETAVIDTGTRKLVYVDDGAGRYQMRPVRIGFSAGGWTHITDGIRAGEIVVTDGNFVLDSQSTLTGGQSLLYGGAAEGGGEGKPRPAPAGEQRQHRH